MASGAGAGAGPAPADAINAPARLRAGRFGTLGCESAKAVPGLVYNPRGRPRRPSLTRWLRADLRVPMRQGPHVRGHASACATTPLTTCEVCGAEASRVLFAPAIHFKGSGFHNTDYGCKRRGASATTDGASGSRRRAGSSNGAGTGSGGPTAARRPGEDRDRVVRQKTVGLDKV